MPRGPSAPRANALRATGTPPRLAAVPSAPKPTRSNGPLSSLAELVTRCIELRGDVETQEVEVRHATSDKAMEIARIRLRTKKLQYEAISSMLRHELASAETEFARGKKLLARAFISASELQATESRIALLARALR